MASINFRITPPLFPYLWGPTLESLGEKRGGGDWREGASSVSLRLELGWCISECLAAFAFVEQYEVVGGDERRTNRESSYRCAHNDWTHCGVGLKMRF